MNKCSCGFDPNPEHNLIDSLYPLNLEGTKWNFHCGVHNGGCGRTVYGSNRDDVVKSWNNGECHEVIK